MKSIPDVDVLRRSCAVSRRTRCISCRMERPVRLRNLISAMRREQGKTFVTSSAVSPLHASRLHPSDECVFREIQRQQLLHRHFHRRGRIAEYACLLCGPDCLGIVRENHRHTAEALRRQVVQRGPAAHDETIRLPDADQFPCLQRRLQRLHRLKVPAMFPGVLARPENLLRSCTFSVPFT